MRILYVTSEIKPFSKTGGLGDVSGELPAAVSALGHDVAVFTPFYRSAKEAATDVQFVDAEVRIRLRGREQVGGLAVGRIPGSDVPVYFLVHDEYYDRENIYTTPQGDYLDNAERYIFMCRACMEAVKVLKLRVDVLHANDWQAALIPAYVKTLYAADGRLGSVPTVLTIHNLAFQGKFWHWDMPLTGLGWSHFNWEEFEYYGKLNLLKGGCVHADAISTVSAGYAKEILTPEQGMGLEECLATKGKDVYGILNGIDTEKWNPETDEFIAANYKAGDFTGKAECKRALQKKMGLDENKDVPLIGMVSRLTDQKGWDLVAKALEKIMEIDCQLAVLGTGDAQYETVLKKTEERHPGKAAARIEFSERLAHEIEAGADIFLMPSRFEPCGLNQMYSMRYGTVPVVRKTGGLADTVKNYTASGAKSGRSNGFVFKDYSGRAMLGALKKAIKLYKDREAWLALASNGMAGDWSWERSAKKYVKLYKTAIKTRKQG